MKRLFSILVLMFFQSFQCSLADTDSNWGVPLNSQVKRQDKKEASESVWDNEMQSYIESEYGSEESDEYLNRGEAGANDDCTGGDSFDSKGY